jgi:hypothetical protein
MHLGNLVTLKKGSTIPSLARDWIEGTVKQVADGLVLALD